MSPETVLALNEINRRFYRNHAEAFSASRDHPWPGWERVMAGLPQAPRSVLDAGCGNGRFGAYLAGRLEGRFCYVGLDASAELLELASRRSDLPDDTTLVPCDLVTETESAAWAERKFSLVATFGLLHHVPSFARRRALLRSLADHVESGGSLIFSVWRFGAFERFQRKQVPFTPPIETADLEPGDALLRFGTQPGVVRYCHFLDEQEADRLIDALPLPCRDRFSADGREQALNDYFVLGPAP